MLKSLEILIYRYYVHLAIRRILCTKHMLPSSLVPRPFRRRKKGLVHIARACAGVSIVTGRITMVITHGFCMTCSSMDDKQRVYDSIRFPQFFLGSPGACACNVYQALSPPEGPGYEASFLPVQMNGLFTK